MSASLIRFLLRASSIAIAVAALVDPVFSSSTSNDRPVVAIHLTAGPPAAIASALKGLLVGRELITRAQPGHRLPCAIDEDCVAIADGSIDSDWEAGRPVSLITADVNTGPNVRVQSVLPGATATEFWDLSGRPVHQLPPAIVMSTDAMVDAALAGLDQGEGVEGAAALDAHRLRRAGEIVAQRGCPRGYGS